MARRVHKPEPETPWIAPQAFDDEAALLLAEYGNVHGHVTAPPIPIDDIVETHFGLVIEYRDLRAEFPEGGVEGALYVNSRKIAIDHRLVPEEYPAMRGRYRFTLAHELAHWRLHRHLYLSKASEPSLSPGVGVRPDHVFRSSASDPKEVQANRLGACILMPREMVKRVWHETHGNMDPVYLDDLRPHQHRILAAEVLHRGGLKAGGDGIDNMLLEHVARPLAEKFEVSPDAMRIRLEMTNLLQRTKDSSLFT